MGVVYYKWRPIVISLLSVVAERIRYIARSRNRTVRKYFNGIKFVLELRL